MAQKQNVHLFSGSNRRFLRRSAGFTTIEILTVVSLIILLSGIGIVAGTKMMAEGKKEQTRAMLIALVGANEEFKAKRQQGSINHDGIYPLNWKKLDPKDKLSSSARFVRACRMVKSAETMMMAAVQSGESETRKALKDEMLYDVWGTEIEYRSSNNKVNGKIEKNYPVSNSPFFVSAGPDKKFGTDDDITSIQDPIYSE